MLGNANLIQETNSHLPVPDTVQSICFTKSKESRFSEF